MIKRDSTATTIQDDIMNFKLGHYQKFMAFGPPVGNAPGTVFANCF
jgi:hypothetical protein